MKKYLIGALALLLTSTAFAQNKDIAGSWVFDAEKSGKAEGPPAIVIAVTTKEVSIQIGGPKSEALVFKLDGTETASPRGATTKAEWKAEKFLATVTTPRGPDTVAFSRDGAWLVMEGQSHNQPMKLYFKKSAAK